MSVNVCPDDIFWTAEYFVTKLGMVMQNHEPECRAEERKVFYLQGQGHSKGLYDLNPRSWELRTQKLKVPSSENTELKHYPFKAWSRSVYIAVHAMLTARDFFLAYLYPSSPFTCIFSETTPDLLSWLWQMHGSCVGVQNKIGHPAWCRLQCLVPAGY